MTVSSLRECLIVEIRLAGLEQIWRRLRLPSDLPLAQVHTAIQLSFGWVDQHMHTFTGADGRHFGVPLEDEIRVLDQTSIRLGQLLDTVGAQAHYMYDPGDGWEHELTLLERVPFTPETAVPFCLGGAMAGPPEDCGGVAGYCHLVEVLRDPSHPEYDERTQWLGGFFFAELFDVNETNERLALHLGRR